MIIMVFSLHLVFERKGQKVLLPTVFIKLWEVVKSLKSWFCSIPMALCSFVLLYSQNNHLIGNRQKKKKTYSI